MRKTIRRSPLVAGVLALLVAASLGLVACGDDGADLPSGVVARVGDADITAVQLDRQVAQASAQLKAQGQTAPAEGSEGFDQLRRQALQTLVQYKIVDFEARKCGSACGVTAKEIDAQLAEIVTTNFNDSQKEFDKFLKQSSISKADAREIVKNQLQQSDLFTYVTKGVRFSPVDAKRYYDDNPDQFKVAAGRIASHILVATQAEADRIRAEVTPENFAELAKENSTDTGSAQQGGSLGQVVEGQFVPQFEKAALALEDGEISQPVKTQFGWHIIMVDITPPSATSFAEARAQIIQGQLEQKRQTTFSEWSTKAVEDWGDRTVYADESLKPPSTTATTTGGVTEDPATTVPAP